MTRRLHFPDSLAAICGHVSKFWPIGYEWKEFVSNFLVMTSPFLLPIGWNRGEWQELEWPSVLDWWVPKDVHFLISRTCGLHGVEDLAGVINLEILIGR